jgi:hypothetical protein
MTALTPDSNYVRDIAYETYRDPILFLKLFLNRLFPHEIPWLHRGVVSILTNKTDFLWSYGEISKIVDEFTTRDKTGRVVHRVFVPRVAERDLDLEQLQELEYSGQRCELVLNNTNKTLIMVPRGLGKTTLAGIGINLYDILFQEFKFGLYVSESGPHAKTQLGNVKRELEVNENILEIFGNLRPERNDPEKWSEDEIETLTGITLVARGRGMQVRGLNKGGQRPDKIIVDDLEDKESVETEHQRVKTRGWAYGDLLPVGSDDSRLIVLGTKLHEQCLLVYWSKDPQFTSVLFGAEDRNGNAIFERKLSKKKLDDLKHSYALAKQLHTYYLEYFNQAVAAETNPFSDISISRERVDHKTVVASGIYVDLAISQEDTANDTVITVLSRLENGKFIVRRQWGGIKTPREMLDEYFRLAQFYQCRFHGFEGNGYQASLQYTLKEEMFRKGWYFEPTSLSHTKKKSTRFMGILQPRIASGYLVVEDGVDFDKCEIQLRDWNALKKEQPDDWPDSLCGAIEIMDPTAASAAGVDLGLSTYPDIETELGDWRLCK